MRYNATICLGFLLALTAGAVAKPELQRFEFAEPHLGTQVRLIIYAATEPRTQAQAAFARIEALNRVFSDYDENSELMKLCRGPVGQAQPLTPELLPLLAFSRQLWTETGGAFDITVGPYSVLWRRARRQRQLPKEADLAAARPSVGQALLQLNLGQSTATLTRPAMRLDLGGIAKGHIAEEAYLTLKSTCPRSMVAIGGDLFLGAAPPGQEGWTVRLGSPDAKEPDCTLLLHDCAVSTAGDSEQYLDLAGQRYSHLLDPRTGWPVKRPPRVTVVAPHGRQADGYDTALCVLDLEAGQRLIESTEHVAARWVFHRENETPEVITSTRWRLLKQPSP